MGARLLDVAGTAGFENWGDCDTVCFKLFDRSPFAWEKARQWAASPREFVKRGGRLIVLDDWQYYREFAEAFLDAKRFPKFAQGRAAIDPKLAKIDPWLAELGASASQFHRGPELRTISRDGKREPGLALLITLPSAAK